MSKTSKSIQMLQLLRSRGLISRQQLAEELKTNIRNIIEYKKELEHAGYLIDTVYGPSGGYILVQGEILPAFRFQEGEKRALKESVQFLKHRSDFIFYDMFERAMDKIQSGYEHIEWEESFYLGRDSPIPVTIQLWMEVVQHAIDESAVVELTYQGISDEHPSTFLIHPYQILYYHEAYYCIAYSMKRKAYRFYRFSIERMIEVVGTEKKFNKDIDFVLKDHVGKLGLLAEELIEVELSMNREVFLRLKEHPIGLDMQVRKMKEEYSVHLLVEGEQQILSFLLVHGEGVYLHAPEKLKLSLRKRIKQLQKQYIEKK